MFVFSNFLVALAEVIDWALWLFMILVIARVVLSWVNADPYNPIVSAIGQMVDPVLWWIRRRVPVVYGRVDLSPLFVFAAIIFLRVFLVSTLRHWAATIMMQ